MKRIGRWPMALGDAIGTIVAATSAQGKRSFT